MRARPHLVLVDDDPRVRRQLAGVLTTRGLHVQAVDTPEEAWDVLERVGTDGALVDLQLADGACGLALLERLHEAHPDLPVGLMTGYELREHQNRAGRIGALAFLKPFWPEDLAELLRRVRLHWRLGRSPLDRLEWSHMLAPRERECAERALRHETHREIAHALGIEPSTVKSYLRRGLDKLAFGTVSELRQHLSDLGSEEDARR